MFVIFILFAFWFFSNMFEDSYKEEKHELTKEKARSEMRFYWWLGLAGMAVVTVILFSAAG